MKAKIALVSIFTGQLEKMVTFYRDVLGFEIAFQMGDYVEFKHEGVRFSICGIDTMIQTVAHPSFKEARSGQPFELAFDAGTADDVDQVYADLVAKGTTPVQAPMTMPWNQRTAFFADPDGNIHEIFADLPQG